jgi:hypothetical protein
MQSHKAIGALGGGGNLGNGDGRGVAGENRILLHNAVELRERFLLLVHIFDDGFNDDVAVGQRLRLADCAVQAATDNIHRLLERAFFGKLCQRLLDPCKTLIKKFLVLLQDYNLIAGHGAHLGNA